MKILAKLDGPLPKAAMLKALYESSRPQGLGMLHFDRAPMPLEAASALLASSGGSFDYLKGRVMKLNFCGEETQAPDGSLWLSIDAWGYDRDMGEGAALAALRKAGIEARGESEPSRKARP